MTRRVIVRSLNGTGQFRAVSLRWNPQSDDMMALAFPIAQPKSAGRRGGNTRLTAIGLGLVDRNSAGPLTHYAVISDALYCTLNAVISDAP